MITILIPTTRRSRLLERTLESLSDCRIPEQVRELVIVENGPKGDAQKILSRVSLPISTRYVHVHRANKSHALNRAIETLPDEEWLLFLDDDVRLETGTIQAYVSELKKHTDTNETEIYLGGPVDVDRESEPPAWMEPLLPLSARGVNLTDTRPPVGFLGCNWMAMAASIRRLGGFNDQLGPGAAGGASGQESEMMTRLEKGGCRPVDVPEAKVWHYVPAERISAEWLDRRFRNYGKSLARSARGPGPVRARFEIAKYGIRYLLYTIKGNRTEQKRSELEIHTRRAYLEELSDQSRFQEESVASGNHPEVVHEGQSAELSRRLNAKAVQRELFDDGSADRPTVSVIIPAWNNESTLRDSLHSIARQEIPKEKLELFVVDNGSTDGTQQVAREAGATLLVNMASKNPYVSRNMGSAKATGDILVFLDATCTPEPGWLQAGLEALDVSNGADLVAGPIRFNVGSNSGLGEWLDSITFVDVEHYVTQMKCAPGGNLFVRRPVWEKLGPFPEDQRSGADMSWSRKATESGFRLVFDEKAGVRYPARDWKGYLKKYHRIGKGAGLQWKSEKRPIRQCLWEILKTLAPPSIHDLRRRIERRGSPEMNDRFVSLWALEWMGRWALALGRLQGLLSTESGSIESERTRPILAFLYYTYYPVRGGASLHGAKLAEGLHQRGYRLVKLNGEPDPWSERWPSTFWSALKLLFKAEKVYARADFLLNGRNALTALALLTGKRVVVELNSPSDELRLTGASDRRIRWSDRIAGFLLRRASAVVVVSEAVGRYARQALGLSKIHIVENGGEKLTLGHQPDSQLENVQSELRDVTSTYSMLALWTGTPTGLQSVSWVREIARRCPELGIIMAVNREPGTDPVVAEEENVCILENRTRDEIAWLIGQAQIGLAFYEPMPWSRWGFYLSPLKIPEFLNSGLHVITNAQGSELQQACPGFHGVQSVEAAVDVVHRIMNQRRPSDVASRDSWPTVRTWEDVATEIDQILQSC